MQQVGQGLVAHGSEPTRRLRDGKHRFVGGCPARRTRWTADESVSASGQERSQLRQKPSDESHRTTTSLTFFLGLLPVELFARARGLGVGPLCRTPGDGIGGWYVHPVRTTSIDVDNDDVTVESLHVRASLEVLAEVRAGIRSAARRLGADSAAVSGLVQAVDEWVTNVTVHGYRGACRTRRHRRLA